jgi:putative endopeptidase
MVVSQPKFFETVNSLLTKLPLEDWKAYLSWNVINTYAGHLSDELVQANFDFYSTKMSGIKEMKPRYKRAVGELTFLPIGQALGKLFVEKYYSKKAQEKINALVDNLTAAFKERIESREWMSNTTKRKAIEKLSAITRKLGFPEKWDDFSSIDITANDYFNDYKNVRIYETNKNLNKLGKPVDRLEWGMPPHMVNAYYNPLMNEIAFPAGIMQPPFFDENAEDAVNYSRIGMVIGHELTHGFDDEGSKFAADGTFTDWWTSTDRDAFEARTKILGETFAQFCPFEGICVNPNLTMGENIADLGGLVVSYNAFKKTDEFKANKSIDGFNPSQRFFISYAQLWKTIYKDEELKKRIATDPHSPGMYRVNGPLKNFPEFYKAFNVQPGDGMYNAPDKVANIW